METAKKDESNSENQAKAQLDSIREMIAALNCDYDRLEDLKEQRDDFEPELGADDIPDDFPVKVIEHEEEAKIVATCGTCGLAWDDSIATSYTPAPSGRCPFEQFHPTWESINPEDAEELKQLISDANDCENREDAEQRIQEDPLSIQVRSDWHTPGDEEGKTPAEFEILLCTGGPAVRIIGDLNEHAEPTRARLQHQDWFTPWTELILDHEGYQTLLEYARCFYYGE